MAAEQTSPRIRRLGGPRVVDHATETVRDWTFELQGGKRTTRAVTPTGGSTNDQVAALLAREQRPGELIGRLYFLPRVGLVVCPTAYRPAWMCCTVVVGNDRYPQGGYDICVSFDELDKGIELRIDVREGLQ